jgi:hypothetical protein
MEFAVCAVADDGRPAGAVKADLADKNDHRTKWIDERTEYHIKHHDAFAKHFQEYHMAIARAQNNMPHRASTLSIGMPRQTPSLSGNSQTAGGGGASVGSQHARVSGGGSSNAVNTPAMLAETQKKRARHVQSVCVCVHECVRRGKEGGGEDEPVGCTT